MRPTGQFGADLACDRRGIDAAAAHELIEAAGRNIHLALDGADCRIDILLADSDGAALGFLHLQPVIDQRAQCLFTHGPQDFRIVIRQARGRHDNAHALVEISLRNDLIIDQRNNALLILRKGRCRGKAAEEKGQSDQAVHGQTQLNDAILKRTPMTVSG